MESLFPGTDNGAAALNAIAPKLNIIKNCGNGGGCLYNDKQLTLDNNMLFNDYEASNAGSWGKAILSDGTNLVLSDSMSDCNTSMPPFPHLVCGSIIIDVNGAKKPNQIGRDTFGFWITKTGVVPFGTPDDPAFTDPCDTSHNGQSCAAHVLTQGMNY